MHIHSIFLTIPLFISVEVQSDFFSLTNNAATDICKYTLAHISISVQDSNALVVEMHGQSIYAF